MSGISDNKVSQIIETLKTLTLLEAAELVKEIESTFGVSAAAPVAAAAPAAAVPTPAAEAEKNEFKVTLGEVAKDQQIKVIKALREVTSALGKALSLKEAKDMVEAAQGAPAVLFPSEPKDNAKKIKETLEAAGAKVTLS